MPKQMKLSLLRQWIGDDLNFTTEWESNILSSLPETRTTNAFMHKHTVLEKVIYHEKCTRSGDREHSRSRSEKHSRSHSNSKGRDRDLKSEVEIVSPIIPRSENHSKSHSNSVERGRSLKSPPNTPPVVSSVKPPIIPRSDNHSRSERDRGLNSKVPVTEIPPNKSPIVSPIIPPSGPPITDADLEDKTPEEQEMMRVMGFCAFDTSKGRKESKYPELDRVLTLRQYFN